MFKQEKASGEEERTVGSDTETETKKVTMRVKREKTKRRMNRH